MTKIVPSPDWFIGLDSVDLCDEGAFLETVVIEVRHFEDIMISKWGL